MNTLRHDTVKAANREKSASILLSVEFSFLFCLVDKIFMLNIGVFSWWLFVEMRIAFGQIARFDVELSVLCVEPFIIFPIVCGCMIYRWLAHESNISHTIFAANFMISNMKTMRWKRQPVPLCVCTLYDLFINFFPVESVPKWISHL